MEKKIQKELRRIEAAEQIEILFAVESGSRAWGFPSKNSDYDVRFIYRHKMKWYLRLDKTADHLEFPINDDLDICGWDLDKTLKLLQKTNPALLEWLNSPIVYLQQGTFMAELRSLSEKYINEQRLIYHYLHMAEGNFREYLKGEQVRIKKYFYVLRPVLACMWLKYYHTKPPVDFRKLLVLPELSAELLEVISELLVRKERGEELAVEAAIPMLNQFFEQQIANCNEYVKELKSGKALPSEEMNQFFLRWLS